MGSLSFLHGGPDYLWRLQWGPPEIHSANQVAVGTAGSDILRLDVPRGKLWKVYMVEALNQTNFYRDFSMVEIWIESRDESVPSNSQGLVSGMGKATYVGPPIYVQGRITADWYANALASEILWLKALIQEATLY